MRDKPKKKPHKATHTMTPPWALSSAEVAAPIPGATPMDENDGVQRMFDYIADADQTPEERAYAALDAYADSAEHLAALCRDQHIPAQTCVAMAQHFLVKTLSHIPDVIAPSIQNGHQTPTKPKES